MIREGYGKVCVCAFACSTCCFACASKDPSVRKEQLKCISNNVPDHFNLNLFLWHISAQII